MKRTILMLLIALQALTSLYAQTAQPSSDAANSTKGEIASTGDYDGLPDKPKFLEVELNYDGFDFEELWFPNGATGHIKVACKGTEWMTVHQGTPYDVYPSSWPIPQRNIHDDIAEFDFYWDLDDYLYVWAHTQNFSVKSDTIFINDYITDPAIRDAWGLGPSAVDAVHSGSEPSISIRNGIISIGIDAAAVKTITLYAANGTMVAIAKDSNEINVENVPHGIYILSISYHNSQRTTKKLIL